MVLLCGLLYSYSEHLPHCDHSHHQFLPGSLASSLLTTTVALLQILGAISPNLTAPHLRRRLKVRFRLSPPLPGPIFIIILCRSHIYQPPSPPPRNPVTTSINSTQTPTDTESAIFLFKPTVNHSYAFSTLLCTPYSASVNLSSHSTTLLTPDTFYSKSRPKQKCLHLQSHVR